jgi:hypothetical protein
MRGALKSRARVGKLWSLDNSATHKNYFFFEFTTTALYLFRLIGRGYEKHQSGCCIIQGNRVLYVLIDLRPHVSSIRAERSYRAHINCFGRYARSMN